MFRSQGTNAAEAGALFAYQSTIALAVVPAAAAAAAAGALVAVATGALVAAGALVALPTPQDQAPCVAPFRQWTEGDIAFMND